MHFIAGGAEQWLERAPELVQVRRFVSHEQRARSTTPAHAGIGVRQRAHTEV
jgi:hypothetical protein